VKSLSRDQIREVERRAIEEYGVPEIVLMENAGRDAAELLIELGSKGLVTICCGRGNNGGDGLVIARHLDNRGLPVHVVQLGKPETPAAKTNYQIVRRSGLPLTLLELTGPIADQFRNLIAPAEWVVDALFGTGLRGPLRSPFDQAVMAINARTALVLAVDIPSGLDCDTGIHDGACVRADYTATFVAPKKGFDVPEAAAWLGQVHVLDIGAPRRCLEEVYG
jgi:NAD(P)H-hydrate epimerase